MNRIVIVGNGFDLVHGLPTRYEDFINWYWGRWLDKLILCYGRMESDNLCKFTLNHPYDTWHSYLFNTPSVRNKTHGRDFIAEIRKHPEMYTIKECHFFKEICKSISEKNWVDIEDEYYKFLHSFLDDTPKYDAPGILNSELDFIKSKLIEYLTSIQKKRIQNLHLSYNIKRSILSPFTSNDISIGAQDVWVNFIKARNELPQGYWLRLLKSYDENDVSNRWHRIESFEDMNKLRIEHMDIEDLLEEEFPEEFLLPERIMLLNFNYTYTADSYLPEDNRFKINHIHGELLKPESVIFGYGDELDEGYKELLKLNENEYLRNMKTIRYSESDNYRTMLSFIESAPYQVCIMGHSCGNSDRTLLNTLFEHKNCVSIKPFFYRKEDGSDNYLDIVQNICRNFTDMKLMRDRVVNKTFCTPLSL